MNSVQIMRILIGVMLLFMLYLFTVYAKQRRKAKSERIVKRGKKKERNYLFHIHRFLSEFPLTKKYLAHLKIRLRGIYPADDITINMKATAMMLTAMTVAFGITAVMIAIAQGDWFFICAGITIAYLTFNMMITGSMERMEQKLLGQLRDFIDNIREQYNRLGRVDDAVGYTLDDLPYEIGLHATRLHQMLTSVHVEEEINGYVDEAPNRYFMMLAAICGTVVEYGDKKIDDGQSMFLKNLNFLKEEVNMELIRRKKNSGLFAGLTFVSLIPIAAIKPIEIWAESNMPEIGEYYKGSYGIVCMAAVFAFSAISYTLVKDLKGDTINETKDRSIFKTIAEIPPIQHFLNVQNKKHYTQAVRHDEMLRMIGDHLGVNAFTVKRFTVAIAVGVVAFILSVSSVVRAKAQYVQDFATSYDSAIVPDKEYRETMRQASINFAEAQASMNVDDREDEEALTEDIMQNSDITDKTLAQTMAQEIIQRVDKYDQAYFKWYYLLGIFALMALGYFLPVAILMFKNHSAKMNMEDEVSQFQTLALILMHVDGVNVTMILEWMERFSFCFKDSISQCIMDIPYEGQKALETLQQSESFTLFQSFVGCLLSIDNVGVQKAFAGLETDRNYYKEKRKEDNEALMRKKSEIGKWIALAPVIFVFAAYLIYPMGKLALGMMSQINSAM